MGELIDFQKYKDGKIVRQIEFIPPRHEGHCPFCNAPTLITRTGTGTEIHTFDPDNMEAYEKIRKLLGSVVEFFRNAVEPVSDDELVEAFGEGMNDFLKEMNGENGNSRD